MQSAPEKSLLVPQSGEKISYKNSLKEKILKTSTPHVKMNENNAEKFISEAIEISMIMNEDLKSLREDILEKIKAKEKTRSSERTSKNKVFDSTEQLGKFSNVEEFRDTFHQREGKIKEIEDNLLNESGKCDNLIRRLDKIEENDTSQSLYYGFSTSKKIEIMKKYTNCIIEMNFVTSTFQNLSELTTLQMKEKREQMFEKLKKGEEEIEDLIKSYEKYVETDGENEKNHREIDAEKMKEMCKRNLNNFHQNCKRRLGNIENFLKNFEHETEAIGQIFEKNINILSEAIRRERPQYEKIIREMYEEDCRKRNQRSNTITQLKNFRIFLNGKIGDLHELIEEIGEEIHTVRESKIHLLESWYADRESARERKNKILQVIDKLNENRNFAEYLSKNFEDLYRRNTERNKKKLKEMHKEYRKFVEKLEDRFDDYRKEYEEICKVKTRKIYAWYEERLEHLRKSCN